MRADVEQDMKRSQSSFLDHVWPVIGPMIGGGRAVSMEASRDSELRNLFDAAGGVDAWQVLDGGLLYGVSSRVQPTGVDYGTFTVRLTRNTASRTEWQKLYEAVTACDGRLYPRWFVQAYMDKQSTRLISVAAIHTDELVRFIHSNCTPDQDTGSCHNARFWRVGWERLRGTCESLVSCRLPLVLSASSDTPPGWTLAAACEYVTRNKIKISLIGGDLLATFPPDCKAASDVTAAALRAHGAGLRQWAEITGALTP